MPNTPGFKPHDLQPFAAALADAGRRGTGPTQPNHLAGTAAARSPDEVVDRTHAQSPDGNAVALDEQLVKLADTETTHALVTTIYQISRHVPHGAGSRLIGLGGTSSWISTRH